MPYQWLLDILIFIWKNLVWILPLGIFIFFFGMVSPITKGVRNIKHSVKETFNPLGFIVFTILMVIALVITGWISNLF